MTTQCGHSQLARSCLLCEMRDENIALRAQVAAQKEVISNFAKANVSINNKWLAERQARESAETKLADCQAVIRRKGHDGDCPAFSSSCVICGLLELLHPCVTYFGDGQKHEFHPGPCSDACGHDRSTGEKA